MNKINIKSIIVSISIFSIFNIVNAQNIGINVSGANAHPSALLDIDAASTPSLGVLIPRIALQAINLSNPVTSPATSLLVFNTATASTGTNAVSPGYYYWDATKWVRFAYNQSGNSAFDWNTLGNASTTPTINFLGTTDAQDLVFRTNNTEQMRIMSNGNIGIGTNNPAEKLTIEGGNFQLGEVAVTPGFGRQMYFSDAGNNAFDPIYFQRHNIANDNSNLNLNIGDNHSNPGGTGGDRFNIGALGGFGFQSILTVLSTSTVQAPGSSILDIRPRVGINVYEPLSDLHVGGNIEASWTAPGATHSLTTYGKLVPGALYLRGAPVGTYSFTNGFIDFVNDAGGGYDFRISFQRDIGPNGSLTFADNVNGGFLNIEQGSGNVGVHTSPSGISSVFQVGSSVADGISIKGGVLSGGDPGDFFFLQNDGTEKGRISTNSSLGVGGLIFSGSTTSGGVNHMNIQQNGNVGIGIANPAGLFELSLDQGRKPGTSTWTIVSDERLKLINGNYNKGLKELMQLTPITYNYKNVGERKFDNEVLKTKQIGFSAQEVQKIFPEAVGTDADGYLNLNIHAILVAYLNAIKELKHENDFLKSNHKTEMEILIKRIDALEKNNLKD